MVKIGDQVRFLNSTGGGKVIGLKGKDIAIVDDNGFETPVLIRECVVIEPVGKQAKDKVDLKPEEVIDTKKEDLPESIIIEETKEGERITACLAYLPVDIKQLSNSAYECYFVNDSNYYLSFNYMSKVEDGWISRKTGLVEPNTKIFIEEFDKAELNDIEKICLQFIAYKKDKTYSLKNPSTSEIKIDTVKFYKLHSFQDNDYFNEKALIYYVINNDQAEKEYTFSAEELGNAMKEKEISSSKRPRIERKNKNNPVIEIDLHINELLDSTSGLAPADLLDYQMDKFRQVMAENLKNKGQKIVFIHGKGNGILKEKIIDELKKHYKQVYYQDASFREYGFGATMVTIK